MKWKWTFFSNRNLSQFSADAYCCYKQFWKGNLFLELIVSKEVSASSWGYTYRCGGWLNCRIGVAG